MGCNCGKNKNERPKQELTPPIIDELPFPDTPDGLLAKELKLWNEEKQRIIMEDLKKTLPE